MQPQAATERSITIQWHPGLLDRLRKEVLGQPNPEEPLSECGGLLVGTVRRDGDQVQIIVRLFTPISCSYQDGQLFHLSDSDKSTLQLSIASYGNPDWYCIGFYRSHCRPGLELDEEDLRLAREHLRYPPIIFLLVAVNGPQDGLFRSNGREFSRDWSFPELLRNPSGERGPAQSNDPGDSVAEGLLAFAGQFPATLESATKTAAHLYGSIAGLAPKRMPGWLACSLVVLVVGLILVWSAGEPPVPVLSRESGNSARSQSRLALATSIEFHQVRIAWNPDAPSVAGASDGTLLIKN